MATDQPVERLKPKDIIEGRALLKSKVQFLDRAGVRDLDQLDTGIFFILAWWSGPAHIALDRLAKAILKADPGGRLELIIADTDGIPELYEHRLLHGKIHGYGECVWKKRGEVLATLFRVGEIKDYEDRVLQILG